MNLKRVVTLLAALALVGCGSDAMVATAPTSSQTSGTVQEQPVATIGSSVQNTAAVPSTVGVEYDRDDMDSTTAVENVTAVTLAGDAAMISGEGATVDGSVVTITSAGTYTLRGILDDGRIIVDTVDEDKVVLVLNGVDITCSTSAPLYVVNAEKTVITLAERTANVITDGDATVLENAVSDEPNAAIFSHDDLTINGSGSLTVNANYNNGIASKDNLKITGGTIVVNAVNDGLKGRDSIAIKDGTITINAGGDGLESTNDEVAEEGFILIESGTISITAGQDGIQAQTNLLVRDGNLTISSGGGSTNSSDRSGWGTWGNKRNAADADADSAKGLKAGVDVTVEGGAISVDSSDDAIHSNGNLTISGGEIVLASGDDGIHADTTLTINEGVISITKSYEGIESAVITINGGALRIVASDDGINTAGGADGSAVGGRPGQGMFVATGDYHLAINGGYIAVDANGDGIDSNGPVDMTAGVVLVNGPAENMNGALDYMGGFNITGGFLVAVGSAGMAEAPSETSTQHSVMVNLSSPVAAGTIIHLQTEEGDPILTFVPTKTYQSVVLSSPDLVDGETYVIYSGGSATGTVTDSLIYDGTYTPGTQVTSLTISSIVTGVGSFGGGFRGGAPNRPGQRP